MKNLSRDQYVVMAENKYLPKIAGRKFSVFYDPVPGKGRVITIRDALNGSIYRVKAKHLIEYEPHEWSWS